VPFSELRRFERPTSICALDVESGVPTSTFSFHNLSGDDRRWWLRVLIDDYEVSRIHRGADMSLAFLISYFPICSTTNFSWMG
jgi:hypothetical protein